jgi:hypothetical protein
MHAAFGWSRGPRLLDPSRAEWNQMSKLVHESWCLGSKRNKLQYAWLLLTQALWHMVLLDEAMNQDLDLLGIEYDPIQTLS